MTIPAMTFRPSAPARWVRLAQTALPYGVVILAITAVAAGAIAIEQQRDRLVASAVAYCEEASRMASAATLDGLREGMESGDDTDGLVYRAALAGFTAQCQQAVQQRLDGMPGE